MNVETDGIVHRREGIGGRREERSNGGEERRRSLEEKRREEDSLGYQSTIRDIGGKREREREEEMEMTPWKRRSVQWRKEMNVNKVLAGHRLALRTQVLFEMTNS